MADRLTSSSSCARCTSDRSRGTLYRPVLAHGHQIPLFEVLAYFELVARAELDPTLLPMLKAEGPSLPPSRSIPH